MNTAVQIDVLHHAFEYHDFGFSVLPLRGKRPAIASWKEFTQRRPTYEEITAWFGEYAQQSRAYNIGIICGRISRVVVLDANDEHAVRALSQALPETQMMTRTAKGRHFYYQVDAAQFVPPRVHVAGMQLDVRGDGSYVVAPPSVHPKTSTLYERIGSWNLSEVPYFDHDWLDCVASDNRQRETKPLKSGTRGVTDGPAYIAHIRAISGQGGHNATFRAACKLRDAGLSEAEALAALVEWNETNAKPPWTVRELLHKVKGAYQRGSPQGFQ